ncbi:MAG: hypothetical protein WCD18_21145 [Thermosynechococcaceae cyanobacterium]
MRVAFLRQAWNEIPSSGDAAWLEGWMQDAKEFESAKELVNAYERLVDLGCMPGDITSVIRGALGQFLYHLSYKLDDNCIEDEELCDIVRWSLWEENENNEPVRRIGCIHELVFTVDPENDEG